MRQPRWSVYFYLLIVAQAIWLKPGTVNQLFGKDVDLSRRITIQGSFKPRASSFAPYLLVTGRGQNILLACAPRVQKDYCLQKIHHLGIPAVVTYAPFKPGWPHRADGVVLQIESGNHLLVREIDRVESLSRSRPRQPVMLVLYYLLTAMLYAIVSIIVIFLGTGLVGSIYRPK